VYWIIDSNNDYRLSATECVVWDQLPEHLLRWDGFGKPYNKWGKRDNVHVELQRPFGDFRRQRAADECYILQSNTYEHSQYSGHRYLSGFSRCEWMQQFNSAQHFL
jgi:hypothetical protein